jgi:SprB repeat
MKKLLLGLVLLICMHANARTLYVSELGSNSNNGTSSATPWQTLSKVQSNVSNYDTVLFAKGSKFGGTLTLNSKNNIYFGVYGTGADPLFWGTGSQTTGLITLNGSSNITFYGWNISDTTISFTDRTVQAKIQYVFLMYSGSTGNTIRRCRMDRMGYGAYLPPGNSNNTMDSCDIGNLRMIRNTKGGDDDYGGVPIQLSSRNNVVTNNYFHDCYAVSYDYGFDGGGVEFFEEGDTVKGNKVMYNTFIDCEGLFEFGSSNDGVANNPHSDNVIAYNKFINNNTVVYINNNGQYKTKVSNLQFYNNVVVQSLPNKNPAGSSGIQFSMATSDATAGIIVLKNNILYITNGSDVMKSGQFNSGQLTHTNNIYTLSGGNLNVTLGGTERSTAIQYWTNTTNSNPLYWDFNLLSTSYAVNGGVDIAGLTRDFIGNTLTSPPDIGILEYGSAPPSPCTFTYGTWTDCISGLQTRTYTGLPVGCSGTPRLDSIQKPCSPPCTYTYGAWGACVGGTQTRTYTQTPTICTGTPLSDSISRTCTFTPLILILVSASNGTIVVSASGGITPYSFSINSKNRFTLNKTTFTGVTRNTYSNLRVKDNNGTVTLKKVYMPNY